MHLYLTGYRGTGKSTVGRLLAERLNFRFYDTDQEIERRAGCTIAEIFAQRGEEAFRDLEAQTIAELAPQQQVVESLGGGAILREANRQTIATAGKVVWLCATAETIAERLVADERSPSQRPRLTELEGLQEISHLLAVRTPLYQQMADFQIDTEKNKPEDLAKKIANWVDLPAER